MKNIVRVENPASSWHKAEVSAQIAADSLYNTRTESRFTKDDTYDVSLNYLIESRYTADARISYSA